MSTFHVPKTSRCPRSDCSGTKFELTRLPMKNGTYEYDAVQCATCGAVVSAHVDLVPVFEKLRHQLGLKA